MSDLVLDLVNLRFIIETLIFKIGVWEFCLDRNMSLLTLSLSARSLSEDYGGKPPNLDALVPLDISDRLKN